MLQYDNCPHCGYEIFKHEDAKFCMRCGKNLEKNVCSVPSCISNVKNFEFPSEAYYCPICGESTTFGKKYPF